MKLTKLFHKSADCGMRLEGQDLVIFRELCLKNFSVLIKEGTTKYEMFNCFITIFFLT